MFSVLMAEKTRRLSSRTTTPSTKLLNQLETTDITSTTKTKKTSTSISPSSQKRKRIETNLIEDHHHPQKKKISNIFKDLNTNVMKEIEAIVIDPIEESNEQSNIEISKVVYSDTQSIWKRLFMKVELQDGLIEYECKLMSEYTSKRGNIHPFRVKSICTTRLIDHIKNWHPRTYNEVKISIEKGGLNNNFNNYNFNFVFRKY
jgi:ribosomal protein L2